MNCLHVKSQAQFLKYLSKEAAMTDQNRNEREKQYNEQDKELTDLQSKYNVDMQEVLNAVIACDNDLQRAEEYLKERTGR